MKIILLLSLFLISLETKAQSEQFAKAIKLRGEVVVLYEGKKENSPKVKKFPLERSSLPKTKVSPSSKWPIKQN